MSLPEDVTVEILSRLPVVSLLRFKCVCKSWNTIINDPIFILKHHQAISCREDSDVVLISRRNNVTNKRVISLLRNDDGNDTTLVDQDLPTFLNDMFGHVRLIGPCNGLVCLYGFPDNIALWNPSIRGFKRLPPSLVSRPPNAKVRGGDLGVGFDSKTRDFKVLQMLFCASIDSGIVCQVEIYSLRTDSWRKYESFVPANIMYFNLSSMVYRNESFCWWAQDCNNVEVILSFDMRKEMFQKTPLPSNIEALGGQHRITRAILPLKESLALIVYGQQEVDKVFDVWIVNELGENVESWRKVMSIGPLLRVERPLGFWKDEFILESSNGELVLYNRANKKFKNLGVYGKRSRLEVLVLRESLFSVHEIL